MAEIDYTRLSTRRLADLLEHSKRSEEDFRERLETRLQDHSDTGNTNYVFVMPDPVAKRLGFRLVDTRKQRRAIERELIVRRPEDSDRYGGGEPDRGNRLIEVRAVAHDDAFSARQQPLSNAFV